MLLHLRRRVEERLANTRRALLSTCGPANIQTDDFECEARGFQLYMRVPLSSDHLFNLEASREVVVTAATWKARGLARVLDKADVPRGLMMSAEFAPWTALIEIRPTRVQLSNADGCITETIDLNELHAP